jgi:aminobenzoyl-glutamate transport protein
MPEVPPLPQQETPEVEPEATGRPGWFTRFLNAVEWLGNLLPHPVTLFALFCLFILVLSGVAGVMGWSVQDPRPEGASGRAPEGVIEAVSLLNGAGLRRIVENLVTNFTGFVPLGTVLVALLGVGVAEKSGLLGAAIRSMVLRAPKNLVTIALVLAGVLSNTASEMGYVVLVPLAGVIFYALGRHPLAGIAAAFAGVSGGYSANLLIGTVDPLLAGITQESARLIDPDYTVHPLVNWWFMQASTFVVTALGAFVTIKIVEPKLGAYDSTRADQNALSSMTLEPLSAVERRGLKRAGFASLMLALLFVTLAGPHFGEAVRLPVGTTIEQVRGWTPEQVQAAAATVDGRSVEVFVPEAAGWRGSVNRVLHAVPGFGTLRNPDTGDLLRSPFLSGIVALIFVFFLVPGVVYGRVAGTMRSDREVIDGMAGAMSSLGLYIVLVFFAAQFVAFFNWTNLGSITAVVGADFLQHTGMTGPIVFIPFILMCCVVNLMLGSASAQWAVTAPIFVPMLMLSGYSPEVIQAAYRIGDSTTNIITPMMSYFGLILAFATRFDRKLGIGTMISIMLPYTLFFIVGWVALFYLWVFGFGFPVGPAAPTYYVPTPAG